MTRGGARAGAGRPAGQGRFGVKTKPVRIPEALVDDVIDFVKNKTSFELPLFSCAVSAGYPSPSDDYIEKTINLNEMLIQHPSDTFFVRVTGSSMIGAGMFEGDLLVVDKSLPALSGKIVIAAVDGELTVKRLLKEKTKTYLVPENPAFNAIELLPENDIVIWGVVTAVLHMV